MQAGLENKGRGSKVERGRNAVGQGLLQGSMWRRNWKTKMNILICTKMCLYFFSNWQVYPVSATAESYSGPTLSVQIEGD